MVESDRGDKSTSSVTSIGRKEGQKKGNQKEIFYILKIENYRLVFSLDFFGKEHD